MIDGSVEKNTKIKICLIKLFDWTTDTQKLQKFNSAKKPSVVFFLIWVIDLTCTWLISFLPATMP